MDFKVPHFSLVKTFASLLASWTLGPTKTQHEYMPKQRHQSCHHTAKHKTSQTNPSEPSLGRMLTESRQDLSAQAARHFPPWRSTWRGRGPSSSRPRSPGTRTSANGSFSRPPRAAIPSARSSRGCLRTATRTMRVLPSGGYSRFSTRATTQQQHTTSATATGQERAGHESQRRRHVPSRRRR